MPMLEDYYCNTCQLTFEYKKFYGEEFPKNPECPKCKGTGTRRKMTINIVIPDYMKSVNS